MLGMAVERVTAMVLVERYDEMWNEKPTLGYALIGITITLSLTINTGMYLSFIPKNYAYASLGLVFCTTGLAFSMLPIVAHRAYKKVKGKRDATVLQRFETGRNLQAARMLMYLAPYKVTTTLLSLTIYFFIYEKVEISLMPLCAQCYWFYNILQVFFQMLLAILCHSCLKDELYLLMGKRRKNEKRRIEDVRTVAGEAMIFDREKANLLYFESLKAAWNVREPPPATFLEIGQQSRQVALNTTRSLMKKIVVQEEKDEKRIELVDNAPPIFLVNDERVTEAEIIAAQIVNGILVQALHHFDASTTSSLLEFTTSKEIRDLCN
ncbi:unnamed protein product, partial [Mesorhabditis belari]|uniref:G protein-coupled receptor n=1 Tax=Mesorhabditis belari TaxID=2138241 RepID=A0AAF3FRV0_9BILA